MVFHQETTREERYRYSVQQIKSFQKSGLRLLKVLRSNLWQDVSILHLLCKKMRVFLLNLKVVLLYHLEDFLNLLLRCLRLPMRISSLSSPPPNGELSGSQSGWRVYSPSPRANRSNDFVRPRESARGRTNRARRSAHLAVRSRAARPNGRNNRWGLSPVRLIDWLYDF